MAKLTTAEFIEAIKELSVLELNDLVKACEEEFGVSAAAGVVVAAAGAGEAAAEEKDEFDVELTEVGANKVKVIKVVREMFCIFLHLFYQVRIDHGSIKFFILPYNVGTIFTDKKHLICHRSKQSFQSHVLSSACCRKIDITFSKFPDQIKNFFRQHRTALPYQCAVNIGCYQFYHLLSPPFIFSRISINSCGFSITYSL